VKKIVSNLTVVMLILLSTSFVFAGEAIISDDFADVINTLDNDPNNTMQTTIQGAYRPYPNAPFGIFFM